MANSSKKVSPKAEVQVEKESAELKQLGFVPQYSSKGYKMASDAYEAVKARAPSPVKEKMANMETIGAPYVSQAADKSSELVKVLDAHVDSAVQSAQSAREQYLKKVEDAVAFLRSQGIKGTAVLAAEQVEKSIQECRKIPGSVLKKVEEAFQKMVAMDSVKKVLASGSYKTLYSISSNAAATVQSTFLYQKAAQNLYPLVAKYADPMYEKLGSLHTQMKPIEVSQ